MRMVEKGEDSLWLVPTTADEGRILAAFGEPGELVSAKVGSYSEDGRVGAVALHVSKFREGVPKDEATP